MNSCNATKGTNLMKRLLDPCKWETSAYSVDYPKRNSIIVKKRVIALGQFVPTALTCLAIK